MSPIKFEDNIQKKLESRTITVSDSAWENVEKRLETFEKSKGKSFWWIGIAASILIAGWVAFKPVNTSEINSPKVVVEPEVTEINSDEIDESENKLIVLSDEDVKKENGESTKVNYPRIERFESKPILVNVDAAPIEVVEISTFEDQKIKEIIAQVLETTTQKSEVTDAEIEALIVQAQKEIKIQELFNENSKTVSADALLYEVEFEIDKSFRDKVFKELKDQFKSMKNAVAQREK